MKGRWKKILKFDLVPEVDTPKPGTRDMHRKVRGQQDARQGHNVITWDKLTTEQKQRFKEGVKCHHCDNKALWKCINPTLGINCFYDQRGNGQGIQVCEGQGPEKVDHLAYENRINGGHRFKSLKGVKPDKEWGYYNPPKDKGLSLIHI